MGGQGSKEGGKEEVEAKGDSDMEGWEDDGWGNFDATPRQDSVSATSKPAQQQQQHTTSSGADFFDSIGNASRTKSKDLFEEFGYSGGQSSKASGKERTPPLLTSTSLFGGGNPAGGTATVSKGDEGGWGDWNDDLEVKPTASSKVCVRHWFAEILQLKCDEN